MITQLPVRSRFNEVGEERNGSSLNEETDDGGNLLN